MHLSYADILERRVPLCVADAAALVLAASQAVCERHTREPNGGCPPMHDVLLTSAGRLVLAGWCPRDDEADVKSLAELLQRLLLHSAPEEGTHAAIPGALLLLVARALGSIDLPAPTLDEFAATVGRFGSADAVTLGRLHLRGMRTERAGVSLPAIPVTPPSQTAAAAAQFPIRRGMTPMGSSGVAARRGDATRPPHNTFWTLPRRVAAAAMVATSVLGGTGLFLHLRPAAPPLASASGSDAPRRPATPAARLASAERAAALAEARADLDAGLRSAGRAGTDALGDSPVVQVAGALLAASDVGADVFSPSFTRGGAVLFHAGRTRGALMQASFDDTGKATVVPVMRDDAANFHGALSLDGQWLAYDSDRDGTRGVYVSRADGNGAERVSGDGYAVAPRWSPDGRTLAFVKAEATRPRVWNVWTVDLRTRMLARISGHAVGQAWGPSWFPDGHRLAYSVEDTLVIVDLRSGRSRVHPSPVRGRLVRTPAVSPDGRRIVFQVFRDGVWMLDVGSGRMQRVLSDATAEEFAWAPSGDSVAYHARVGGAWSLWTLPLSPGTS